MIEVKRLEVPDPVDRKELKEWQESVRRSELKKFPSLDKLPPEVIEFVDAVADKMGDFGRRGEYTETISGKELKLCNHREWGGAPVMDGFHYKIAVPVMQAVDHRSWMFRIFRKRGKQGLIDYCLSQVKGTDLERTLQILNVEVFHQDRSEFKHVMSKIKHGERIHSQ